jgi:hypothetical protein
MGVRRLLEGDDKTRHLCKLEEDLDLGTRAGLRGLGMLIISSYLTVIGSNITLDYA